MPEYKIVGTVSDYNIEKLDTELRANQFFNGLITRKDDVYTLLDNLDRETIDGIDSIVVNHNDELTSEQKSQLAEDQIASSINKSKRVLHLVAPLYNQRAIDLASGNLVSIDTAYANIRNAIKQNWRGEGSDMVWIESYLRNLCLQHYNIDYDNEPDFALTAYKTSFLRAVYELIDSINAQYKF